MVAPKSPPVDVGKALELAATISKVPFMLVVDAKCPYQNVAELTRAMKAKGANASYATRNRARDRYGRLYNQMAGCQNPNRSLLHLSKGKEGIEQAVVQSFRFPFPP